MPGNVYWIGAAAVVPDLLSYAISAPTLGASKSLSFNERTITVIAADTSAATLAQQFADAINNNTDARVRDGTASVSGTTLLVTGPNDGAPLTNAAGSTGVVLTYTAGTGPYHAGNAANWDTGVLPTTGDTPRFRGGTLLTGPRYQLSQFAAVVFADVVVEPSYLGRIGLPNNRGPYVEFRPKYFQAKSPSYKVYSGQADPDERFKIRSNAVVATAWIVQGVGTTGANGLPLEVQGTVSTSTIVCTNYGVNFAPEPAAATVFDSVIGAAATFAYGSGASVTTVQHNGGQFVNAGTVTTGTFAAVTGAVIEGGNVVNIEADAGQLNWRSSASPTAFVGVNSARIDFSQAAAVLTAPTFNVTPGCVIVEGDRLVRPWAYVVNGGGAGDVQVQTSRNVTVTIDN